MSKRAWLARKGLLHVTSRSIGCTGEGRHKARPYEIQFFVGATLVVALHTSDSRIA
jgi:hypothetical protein